MASDANGVSGRAEARRQKRERIVEAAIRVFARNGFGASRVSDIAREAGVADGTIYLYFQNKEDILLTIFEEKMAEVLDGLRAALDEVDDPIERIAVFARYHFEQLRRNPALAQVFQVELRQSRRFFRGYRPERLWDYLALLESAIRDGQAAGRIREDVDPFLLKWGLFGALDELAIQWVVSRKRDRFDLDRAAVQVVEVFLRGMLRPTLDGPEHGSASSNHQDPKRRSA